MISLYSHRRRGRLRLVCRSSRAGLTVLELVSALALMVIILGMLLVTLNTATDMWTHSADKNRARQKVRHALDQMATDLAGAFASSPSGTSSTSGSAQEPLFIAEGNDTQIGLYFIRTLSPAELTAAKQLSLELVAYSWTTNGLSRYTRPVAAATPPSEPPDLSAQLLAFKNAVSLTRTPSNVLASAIVDFEPRLYQPLTTANAVSDTEQVPLALNNNTVNLDDLPDFVDLLVAYVNPADWTSAGFSATNYMTRRVTLPAAQASRLP